VTLHKRLQAELDDEDIEKHMRLMKAKFPPTEGLQATVLGSCVTNMSAPMFSSVSQGGNFVQPLNVGDHWITAMNVLSDNDNEVQILYSTVRDINESTVLQTPTYSIYTRQVTLACGTSYNGLLPVLRSCSDDSVVSRSGCEFTCVQ